MLLQLLVVWMGRKGLGNYSRGSREKKSMNSEGHKANVALLESKVGWFLLVCLFLVGWMVGVFCNYEFVLFRFN